MPYYRTRIQQLEDIRSRIKHLDPETIDLYDIRDTLGPIIADLEILGSLRRPKSYKIEEIDTEIVRVTIEMELPVQEAEDMVRKLWLGDDI